MRHISATEYQNILEKSGREISLGHIYNLMRKGDITFNEVTVEKKLKLIPWDDEKQEICQSKLVDMN